MNAERLLQHYEQIADAPDAIARLRRFILDLAVRGKLVLQDSADEPATELLKRIAAEKAALLEAGKIRKEKPLPAVEEPDFEIPASWRWSRLGVISSYIQRGKSPKYAVSDGAPVVSQRCVQWSGLDLSVAKQITLDSLAQYEDVRFIRDNDLLWNSTGTGTIGRVIRVVDPPAMLVCDSHVTVVRCLLVDADYVRLWLRSDHVYALIEDRAAGSTNQVELTAQMALNQTVPLPPLAEQHRIVAKVDELMALCDELEAARTEQEMKRDRLAAASLARLNTPDPETFRDDARFALDALPALTARPDQIKQLRQTILNLAVRGKLVPQDPADEPAEELYAKVERWRLYEIGRKNIRAPRKPLLPIEKNEFPYGCPQGWMFARLGSLIYIQSGDGLTAANMKDGPFPVFGGNGVNGYHDHHNVDKPTVVIGRVGYYCGSVHVTPERAWVTDNAFITHFPEDLIRLRFLVLLLNATNLKEEENATAQPVISGSKIYPLVVGLPPLAEQHRIVAKVDELMALCDQLETSLTSADETRRKLLDALLAEALAPVDVDALQEAAE